ncbi:4a-hydroxytetrahydrobiopterin dehydratase [Kitasatospora sp. NPDC088391]|uniref:4a-hydroxytetrahydrobiopterin dehydratase n=1 Tax=Kitasatospora sp. NPDC088391 TaxID=3364074 RepID=UPI00380DE818
MLLRRLGELSGGGAGLVETAPVAGETAWPDRLREALAAADVLLALIDPDWLRQVGDSASASGDGRDWLRQEVEYALAAGKAVLPVTVQGARMPPPGALPAALAPLARLEAVELRGVADLKKVAARLAGGASPARPANPVSLYPRPNRVVPAESDAAQIEAALADSLRHWEVRGRRFDAVAAGTAPDDQEQIGLYREFGFRTFQDAVAFMHAAAPGCDVANHHPDWGNVWKTVRVFLTTWDIGHRISERDIELAEYLERAYRDFPGRHPRG